MVHDTSAEITSHHTSYQVKLVLRDVTYFWYLVAEKLYRGLIIDYSCGYCGYEYRLKNLELPVHVSDLLGLLHKYSQPLLCSTSTINQASFFGPVLPQPTDHVGGYLQRQMDPRGSEMPKKYWKSIIWYSIQHSAPGASINNATSFLRRIVYLPCTTKCFNDPSGRQRGGGQNIAWRYIPTQEKIKDRKTKRQTQTHPTLGDTFHTNTRR